MLKGFNMYLYDEISEYVKENIPSLADGNEVFLTFDELVEFISYFCAEFDGVEEDIYE